MDYRGSALVYDSLVDSEFQPLLEEILDDTMRSPKRGFRKYPDIQPRGTGAGDRRAALILRMQKQNAAVIFNNKVHLRYRLRRLLGKMEPDEQNLLLHMAQKVARD